MTTEPSGSVYLNFSMNWRVFGSSVSSIISVYRRDSPKDKSKKVMSGIPPFMRLLTLTDQRYFRRNGTLVLFGDHFYRHAGGRIDRKMCKMAFSLLQ